MGFLFKLVSGDGNIGYVSEFVGQFLHVSKSNSGELILSKFEAIQNNPFAVNSYFDNAIIDKMKTIRNCLCYVSPSSKFIYTTKIDIKQKKLGLNGLVKLAKEKFNISFSSSQISVLDSTNGLEIKDPKLELPENICLAGADNKELTSLQSEFSSNKIVVKSLGMTTLCVVGGLINYLSYSKNNKPVMVIDFSISKSPVFVIQNGKLAAAYPPVYGLVNLITVIRKYRNLPDDIAAYKLLTGDIVGDKIAEVAVIQRICLSIQSYIDFFEVQFNESICGLFINSLPDNLQWIMTTLSEKLGVPVLEVDYKGWVSSKKVTMENVEELCNNKCFGILSAAFASSR